MASLVDFIDRVRTLQDLPPHGAVALAGSDPDDEHACVLAAALGCRVASVGGEDDGGPEWLYAMCFDDRLLARRIGIVLGLEWGAEPPAVRLPEAIADLAVSQHLGKVEADDIGFLRGWWVPVGDEDDGEWEYLTPYDGDLLPDAGWKLPSPGGRHPRV